MKEYLSNYDLSLGCLECKEHLNSMNFSAVVAKMFDHQKLNKNKYPCIMEFELDNTCNLECIICAGRLSSAIRKNRERLAPVESPYNENFVEQLEEFIPYLDEARFYGGEPFLIKIYYDIWEHLININPGIKIYVQTNGTILNERIKKLMDRGRFHINISIDAIKKEVFEKLRVNADFDLVMENLMYFHNYTLRKKTFFCITPTIMRDNWQEFPGLIQFSNKLNIPLFYNTLYRPEHLALNTMREKELENIVEHLEKFSFQTKNSIQKQNNYYYYDFVNLVKKWKGDAGQREKSKEQNRLSIDEAREKLINNLKMHFDSRDNSLELSSTMNEIDTVLNCFDDKDELSTLYNKMLEIPVTVIIEQAKTFTGLDKKSIIKLVRNYL